VLLGIRKRVVPKLYQHNLDVDSSTESTGIESTRFSTNSTGGKMFPTVQDEENEKLEDKD
jgi:hypothetical protein